MYLLRMYRSMLPALLSISNNARYRKQLVPSLLGYQVALADQPPGLWAINPATAPPDSAPAAAILLSNAKEDAEKVVGLVLQR